VEIFELAGFQIIAYPGATGLSLHEATELAQHTSAEFFHRENLLRRFFMMAVRQPFPALMLITPNQDGDGVPNAIRAFCKIHEAVALWTCAEVWMREVDREEFGPGMDLSKDPLAVEKVMLIRESPFTDPHHTVWVASIDRAQGRSKLLAWHKHSMGQALEGRLAYMLPRTVYR
jgi:hypothetical protein